MMLFRRWFLLALVIANAVGTVWGIAWYWDQLQATPWYLLPVVPDSPLSAALFGLYAYWLLRGGRLSSVRSFLAWAGVLGVIKYGLWTEVILTQYFLVWGVAPDWQDWMLYLSHGGMAAEGLVYAGRLPRSAGPAVLAVLWLGLNDGFDYLLFTHPRLPLPDQVPVAGWTAAGLTVLVAVFAAWHFTKTSDPAGR